VTAMDDLTKKLLVQLDDPMPGQRSNAFEMLCQHFTTTGQSWRGIAQDIERADEAASLRQENAQLTARLAQTTADLSQHQAAIAQWQRAYALLGAKLAAASAIAWGRTTGRRLAAYVALPALLLVGYLAYDRYWWPAAVDEGLRRIAASETWQDGFGNTFVRVIAGAPCGVLMFGDTDTASHTTAQGVPVGMHCVHVFAHPAKADFGQYVKADPHALFGWWRTWPERAVDCKSFPLKEAQK
jgi:hypothetical protein